MPKTASSESSVHKVFRLGRKVLSADINTETADATIRIGTTDCFWVRRVSGETTGVYLMAEEFMQSVADETGQDIVLRINTANSNLKQWVAARADLLQFEIQKPESGSDYRVAARKVFHPKNKP